MNKIYMMRIVHFPQRNTLFFWLITIITLTSFQDLCSHKPRVSIITSVYRGDAFITAFLKDIVQQTIFDQCELIIINANSPGNEEPIIEAYTRRYPNIVYIRLSYDPGLYGVWNKAIQCASADYVTNANLDDCVHHTCYEMHADTLDAYPEIDLVYSDYYLVTRTYPNFACARKQQLIAMEPFSVRAMQNCLPNNHPMWRKSLHERFGFFDEQYRSAGDWEMWLRAVAGGAQFMKIYGVYGICYLNPEGLSTNPSHHDEIRNEQDAVRLKYQFLWHP